MGRIAEPKLDEIRAKIEKLQASRKSKVALDPITPRREVLVRPVRGICTFGILPDERKALALVLRDRFMAESPLESNAAKGAMAETLAITLIHQGWLFELMCEGTIMTEEAKTLNGLGMLIKRLCDGLKITEPPKQVITDLLGGDND